MAKHLRFSIQAERFRTSTPRGSSPELKERRNRESFVKSMRKQLKAVEQEFEFIETERESNQQPAEFGLILNVESEPGYKLKHESLEDQRAGISLLNLRHETTPSGEVTKAAIFVPFGKLEIIQKKVEDYATKDNTNRQGQITGPKNSALLNNIRSIAVAALEALWTDPEPIPVAEELVWFELWIRRDNHRDWKSLLLSECQRLEIEVPDQVLTFPDHLVVIANASRVQLESSLELLKAHLGI